MASMGTHAPAPWHLWVVGIVALLFTLFGGYDYYMSQTANAEYMAMMVEPMGVDPAVAVEYFASFPLWADLVWAVGVWGGVAASVLLLLRSRFAYPVFVLSLVAMVVSNAYALMNPVPGLTTTPITYAVTATIFLIMLLITLYARAMTQRGVLR